MTHEEHLRLKPVHDNSIHAALKHLAAKEAAFAHERYGYYHSPHEGLAIVEEEAWEAEMAMNYIKSNVDVFGIGVRKNWHDFDYGPTDHANGIEQKALHLAQEAIHVAATAMRFQQALEAGAGEFAYAGECAYIAKDENRG